MIVPKIPLLPRPPMELRQLIGPTDDEAFDNPTHQRIFRAELPDSFDLDHVYRRVFDFGCGCGRQARQLMLQETPPDRYVGVDISRKMITWCRDNLTPHNPSFTFHHHDVFSLTYAPDNTRARMRPLEFPDGSFTLINAHSVFTHLYEDQAIYYLKELARMTDVSGLIRASFFTMNRDWFPPLAEFQHSVFLNEIDPTQAVYFDWRWLQQLFRDCGLRVAAVYWPQQKGVQFPVILTKRADRGHDPFDVWPEPGSAPGF